MSHNKKFQIGAAILFLITHFAETAIAKNDCDAVFTGGTSGSAHDTVRSNTSQFITYLSYLLENQSINFDVFKEFVNHLNAGNWVNPIPIGAKNLSARAQIQYQTFEAHWADNSNINTEHVLGWANQYLSSIEQQRQERQQSSTSTAQVSRVLKFNFVPRGSFVLRDDQGNVVSQVTLSHDFEVSETLITQEQWIAVMGDNASYGSTGRIIKNVPFIDTQLNGKVHRIQPDHPVDCLTWWSALVFANRMSALHNLKEVYDLSEILFYGEVNNIGRDLDTEEEIFVAAANGTLQTRRKESRYTSDPRPKISAQDGDIYKANGYRLLTDVEHAYLRLGAGKYESFGAHLADHREPFEKYASVLDITSGDTFPVASLAPHLIHKSQFFDLWGTAGEYAYDPYDEFMPSGMDPIGRPDDRTRVTVPMWGRQGPRYQDSRKRQLHSTPMQQCGIRLGRTLVRD